MKRFAVILCLFLVSCGTARPPACGPRNALAASPRPRPPIQWRSDLPVYKHIVIVVEENKDYDQIIGNPDAPYINDVLQAEGANLLRMYAEEHHSQGNYFWLFSGSNQDVGFWDRIPRRPRMASNLGEQLIKAGRSFKGYSEGLPAIGSTVKKAGLYARKHVPWVSFPSLRDSNLRLQDFPADYNDLPTVSFVIPNLANDMHNGSPLKSIKVGDQWLKDHLDKYYQWAKDNESLLILTFDENDHGPMGLTDLAAPRPAKRNRIVTILAGAFIKPGFYSEGRGVTHVNLLRTLEAMYGLGRAGEQQPFALCAGIPDDRILIDVFVPKP
jgi:acid phosphatase